jgi:hypothetical protein
MRYGRMVGLGACVLLLACSGPPRVDNSSATACQESFQRLGESAPDTVAFAQAFMGIASAVAMHSIGEMFGSLSFAFDDGPSVSPPASDSTDMTLVLCDVLAGLTAVDIVAHQDSLSRSVSVTMEERSARAYLRELRAARDRAGAVKDSLAEFRVLSAALDQKAGFMGLEATIRLRVRNETAHPVSRAYFAATAQTPGRSVPWLEETFNHSISGGLEPGEERNFRLTPNMFQGKWSSVRVPAGAAFTVEVTRLDGPNGNPLWGGARFSPADALLLDSLTTRFGG